MGLGGILPSMAWVGRRVTQTAVVPGFVPDVNGGVRSVLLLTDGGMIEIGNFSVIDGRTIANSATAPTDARRCDIASQHTENTRQPTDGGAAAARHLAYPMRVPRAPRRSANLLAAAALLATAGALAQPQLLADINQGNGPVADSYPDGFKEIDGAVYFSACSDAYGCELWRSYEGIAGAQPVADTCPGRCGGNPRDLADSGPGVLFSADDGQHGRELWLLRTNSGQPPEMLPEVRPGPYDSDPRHVLVTSSSLNADTVWAWVAVGEDSWRIARLSGLYDDPAWDWFSGVFDDIGPIVEQGGRLFAVGRREGLNQGTELWRIDTPAGTPALALVRDIRPGSEGASILDLIPVPQRGGVFFRANDGSSGSEPWFSDGTPAGTRRLADIAPGAAASLPSEPLAFANGSVFFFADDQGAGGNRDLWAVDGTALAARKVRNFSNGAAQGLRAIGGGMVFIASDGGSGAEFWASGGFLQNTFQITDLIPGSSGLGFREAVVAGNFYYLSTGDELYRTDITAAGTRRVGPGGGELDIQSLSAAAGRVLLGATEGAGAELYHSRLDAPHALDLIGNLAQDLGHSQGGEAWSQLPGYFELSGGTVLFAFDEDEGLELRRLDGSGVATVLAATVAGPDSTLVESRLDGASTVAVAGRLYFVDSERALWTSDGTAAGTRRLEQFGAGSFQATGIACVLPRGNGDVLALLQRSGNSSMELWRVDGAGGPTQALLTADLMPAGASLGTNPRGCPVELGGQLLLRASLPATGFELYRSNLSPGHLVLLRDLAPGAASGLVSRVEPALAGGKLYFSGDSSGIGANAEPWVSDGTAQGTFQLHDTGFDDVPGPHSFTAYGSDVVFAADGKYVAGHQLWRSNGTLAGTRPLTTPVMPVATVMALDETGPAGRVIAVEGTRIFFVASPRQTPGAGSRLYVSQGQPGDLRLLEPATVTGPLVPQQLRAVPGAGVVFSGFQWNTARELWFSDGTGAGTVLVADVSLGYGEPQGISVLSDGVYFTADDYVRGREPWRLPIPRAEAIFVDGFDP